MSEEIKHYILKNGLVLGGIYVGIDIIKYFFGAEFFVNIYVSYAALLLAAIFPIYYLLHYKKSQDGFIDFRSAFSICTGILIASGFISLVFNILLFNIIDPEFSSELLDITINTAVIQLEAFGMSHEQISSAIEVMESEANFSPMNMIKGFGFTIVGYTLFGVIVAAFTKKNNEFINQ